MPDRRDRWVSVDGSFNAVAGEGGYARVDARPRLPPPRIDPGLLARAHAKLEEMPLDRVPGVAPLPDRSVVGVPRYRHFVGRGHALWELARLLKPADGDVAGNGKIAAATGLAGVGKTQIASEFVHRYGAYFLGGVYWINFSDPSRLPEQVAACGGAGAMELHGDFDELAFPDQIRTVRAAWQSAMPRLLVFDNCEDEGLLRRWQPASGGCRVLVASQRANWAPSLSVTTVSLDVFERSDSVTLLRKHGSKDSSTDPVLNFISETLGDLPLAIDLAGRFIGYYSETVGPDEYLEELREQRIGHESLTSGGGHSPTDHLTNVRRTFELSYRRLSDKGGGPLRRVRAFGAKLRGEPSVNDLAKSILSRLRFLAAGEPVALELLSLTLGWGMAPGVDERRRMTDARKKLVDLGLLSQNERTGDVWIHTLVAQATGEASGKDRKAQRQVQEAVLARAHAHLHEDSPLPFISLTPHLRAAREGATGRGDKREHDLCAALGHALFLNGDYETARPEWERALEISKQRLGLARPITLQDFENVGTISSRQKDLDRALDVYGQVLRIHRSNPRYQVVVDDPSQASEVEAVLFSSVHLNIGATMRDKAFTERDIELLRGVYPHYERALVTRELGLGAHPDTAESLHNMGALMMDLRNVTGEDYPDPKPYLLSSRDMYEQLLSSGHVNLLGPLIKLGKLYRDEDDETNARSSLDWALCICRRSCDEDDPRLKETRALLEGLDSEG